MHGGHPISSGVRYILVAFCTIDPAYMGWAASWYEHVQDVIDPGDEDGKPQEKDARARLPGGLLTASGPDYRKALGTVTE